MNSVDCDKHFRFSSIYNGKEGVGGGHERWPVWKVSRATLSRQWEERDQVGRCYNPQEKRPQWFGLGWSNGDVGK